MLKNKKLKKSFEKCIKYVFYIDGVQKYGWSPEILMESRNMDGVKKYRWSPEIWMECRISMESRNMDGVQKYRWSPEIWMESRNNIFFLLF